MTTTPAITRFDPTPGEPYGTCRQCNIAYNDKADALEHLTTRAYNGHSITVSNRSRDGRIKAAVESILQDAYDNVVDELLVMVVDEKVLTVQEVTTALAENDTDINDAWADAELPES